MTVPMALVDYIPVVLFLFAALLLQHDLYGQMRVGQFAMLCSGTTMIFIAGVLKATWKLLYALNICDFVALNNCFFPMQSIGFVLAGVAMLGFALRFKGVPAAAVAAPLPFTSSMPFVLAMVLGVAALCGGLAVVAKRLRRARTAGIFAVAFVLMLGMGYLSSKDFTLAVMNWVAQGVNILAQGALLAGVLSLHRAGLAPKKRPAQEQA